MFTGIVSDIGHVHAIDRARETRVAVTTAYDTAAIDLGASIACAGICLTVVDTAPGSFAVEVSEETLARTTAAGWRAGSRINLERSLTVGSELGGHLVSGHIDGTARVLAAAPAGDSVEVSFAMADWLAPYIAPKGSVALDGVSLTVNEVSEDRFTVNLIPHTLSATTFDGVDAGRIVNVEIDMLARYVRRALEWHRPEAPA